MKSNLWLKKQINSEELDAWLSVSYLYRYPTVGIHEYICKKLKYIKNINTVIPQLVHIFLYHSDSEVSKPLYNILKYWSMKSKKFYCTLYFYLKACLDNLENSKSLQCYFLICELLKYERRNSSRNIKILKLQLKYGRRINRTIGFNKERKGLPNFDGIFLYFLRSISWVIDLNLYKNVKNYENIFKQSKFMFNINFIPDLSSGFAFNSCITKNSIMMLETLAVISERLKKLPKNLRQRGLEMELKLINCNLPAKIQLPFCNSKYLLKASIEYSHLLNSAENTPYMIAFEVADEMKQKSKFVNDELKNAAFLMQQLNAVSRFTYLNDNNNTKDNILMSLERILNAERADENITELNIENTKAQEISEKINEKKKKNLVCKRENKKQNTFKEFVIDEESIRILTETIEYQIESEQAQKNNLEQKDISEMFFKEAINEDKTIILKDESKSTINIMNDEWKAKEDKLRETSEFSKLKGWKLSVFIVKTGCLKQEIIAYQILTEMRNIWKEENNQIWVKPYQIYFINNNAGLVETVTNAYSIHKIKEIGQLKNKNFTLKQFFEDKYGKDTDYYKQCVKNFLESLVGYSLACYILQIKDRHNGNILLDNEGHLIHVDFGFILGEHPGFYCVEVAPFKLSNDYLELLGDTFEEFKIMFLKGFQSLRKHSERLCRIIEIISDNSDIRCINKRVLLNFRDRLKLEMSDKEIELYAIWLINKSLNNIGTGLYDSYQYFSNGYR